MNIRIGLAFKTIISVKKSGHDKQKFPKLWEEREGTNIWYMGGYSSEKNKN